VVLGAFSCVKASSIVKIIMHVLLGNAVRISRTLLAGLVNVCNASSLVSLKLVERMRGLVPLKATLG